MNEDRYRYTLKLPLGSTADQPGPELTKAELSMLRKIEREWAVIDDAKRNGPNARKKNRDPVAGRNLIETDEDESTLQSLGEKGLIWYRGQGKSSIVGPSDDWLRRLPDPAPFNEQTRLESRKPLDEALKYDVMKLANRKKLSPEPTMRRFERDLHAILASHMPKETDQQQPGQHVQTGQDAETQMMLPNEEAERLREESMRLRAEIATKARPAPFSLDDS